MRLILLLLFSFSAGAESFDIFLPLNTQYAPGALDKHQFAFTIGFVEESNNFQLQVQNKTGSEQFIKEEYDYDVSMGLAVGLGSGFEAEFNGYAEGSMVSLKYDIASSDSILNRSVVVSYLKATGLGHGGNVLPEEEEDCGFFDLFCFLNFEDLFCLGGCSDSVNYEFDYEAEISGLMLAYLHGYRYSPNSVYYWGVHYVEYDIEVDVIDNTGGGANTRESLQADLGAVTFGARWRIRKNTEQKNSNYILLTAIPYKFSRSHDGDIGSEIRLSYKIEF